MTFLRQGKRRKRALLGNSKEGAHAKHDASLSVQSCQNVQDERDLREISQNLAHLFVILEKKTSGNSVPQTLKR